MRAVVQRVSRGEVRVDRQVIGRIGHGLVVLLGCRRGDGMADVEALAAKVVQLRIFPEEASGRDASARMSRSVHEVGGGILVVPQFTLYGDTRRGRRPSFTEALEPVAAERLYEAFVQALRNTGITVETGRFRADMDVELVNRGPVTLLLESGTGPIAG